MNIAHIAKHSPLPAALRPLLLLLSLSLGGCVTTNPGSSVMDAHAEVPAPAPAHVYPPVEVAPAGPAAPGMTTDQQAKLKKELLDARSRQAGIAKARNGPSQPGSAKPQ